MALKAKIQGSEHLIVALEAKNWSNQQRFNKGSKNASKSEFSKMAWPGVEMIPTPRGIILHHAIASQLPYMVKFQLHTKIDQIRKIHIRPL